MRDRCVAVPVYRIHISNHEFSATNETDLPSRDAARMEGMRGALAIGTEEICAGKTFFGAEVAIIFDGETIDRLVIALGASPLL